MSATTSKKMTYVRLGNSGLKVSRIILGTMQYGDKDWQQWVIDDEEEAFKHIQFAYDAGITTFDTADAYSNGRSEEILGAAIKKFGLPREELVILTKVYGAIGPKGVNVHQHGKTPEDYGIINQKGLSRKHIFDAVQASLKRLQLEYIDVLQCHRFDYDTPIEETMQALHDVVKAGYVRYIGMSSCYAYQFTAMQNYAITNKLTPFISMQNHYNLLYREEEREMLPTLKSFGVGVIPWSPLARGALTRPYDEIQATSRGKSDLWATHYPGAGVPGIIKRVEELAKKKGVTMAQVAVAWTLSKDSVTAPIVGTTKLQNLEEIIAAIDIKLTDEEIKSLEEPYQPTKVFGHL